MKNQQEWITDRLPTKEEANELGRVLVATGLGRINYWLLEDVEEGMPWMLIPNPYTPPETQEQKIERRIKELTESCPDGYVVAGRGGEFETGESIYHNGAAVEILTNDKWYVDGEHSATWDMSVADLLYAVPYGSEIAKLNNIGKYDKTGLSDPHKGLPEPPNGWDAYEDDGIGDGSKRKEGQICILRSDRGSWQNSIADKNTSECYYLTPKKSTYRVVSQDGNVLRGTSRGNKLEGLSFKKAKKYIKVGKTWQIPHIENELTGERVEPEEKMPKELGGHRLTEAKSELSNGELGARCLPGEKWHIHHYYSDKHRQPKGTRYAKASKIEEEFRDDGTPLSISALPKELNGHTLRYYGQGEACEKIVGKRFAFFRSNEWQDHSVYLNFMHINDPSVHMAEMIPIEPVNNYWSKPSHFPPVCWLWAKEWQVPSPMLVTGFSDRNISAGGCSVSYENLHLCRWNTKPFDNWEDGKECLVREEEV